MVIVKKEVDSAQLVQLRSAILDKLESIRHQKFDDKKIDKKNLDGGVHREEIGETHMRIVYLASSSLPLCHVDKHP